MKRHKAKKDGWFEKRVKKLKRTPKVNNPWALARWQEKRIKRSRRKK